MDHDAFEHIAHQLRPRLTGVGQQFFGDKDTAEDIAQETLMRLWLVRDRIDPELGIEPLAVRMAKNLCVSEWRKRQLRQAVQSTGALPHASTTGDDTIRQLEASEAIARLRWAVTLLTPTEQRLFRMRHELEMELTEMEAVTGIGVRSISAMLSTAKRKLLQILNQKGGQK